MFGLICKVKEFWRLGTSKRSKKSEDKGFLDTGEALAWVNLSQQVMDEERSVLAS